MDSTFTSFSGPDVVVLTNAPYMTKSTINDSTKGRTRIRPYPLSDVSDLKVQQGLIIKDLMFTLLGYEGNYIRYSERYNPNNMDQRIRGPDFKTAKHLDISLKSITKKLIDYGKYYLGLTGFVEYYDNSNYGTIIQNLCYNINEFLVNYQEVILKIENEFQFNSKFNLSVFESLVNKELYQTVHLYEIVIQIHETTVDRQAHKVTNEEEHAFLNDIRVSLEQSGNMMDASMVSSQNFERCKGGLVLKIVQNRINKYKGDVASHEFLTRLFDSISENYIHMLNNWLINGEIDDQFDEFMIREKKVSSSLLDFFNSKSEHYWSELFVVRSDGLIDQFQNVDIQRKILNTGKYLNIFKQCTGIHDFKTLKEIINPITKIYSQNLELKINEFYLRANKLLLKLLFEGFYFGQLIRDFQSIFLFNNSYHIDTFIGRSLNDLKRDSHSISVSKMTKQFDEIFHTPTSLLMKKRVFSISSSNFYDVAMEIMNVPYDTAETAESVEGRPTDPNRSDDYTISRLDLAIELPFPLNLIINRGLSYQYELMFKLLVMVKFINKFNNATWLDINHSQIWKFARFEPRLKKWILRCRILHTRMRDFLNELQVYLNFDVIETNYVNLEALLKKMEAFLKEEQLGSDINESLANVNYTTFNTNSIFGNRLLGRKSMYRQNGNSSGDNINALKDDQQTVEHLITNLNEFLNTLINDSFITKPGLLDVLKHMFDTIILFNNFLNRVKKILILCNEELFTKYSGDYPDKFNDRTMDADLVETRFKNLSTSLKIHYDIFGDSLNEFIVTLKAFGEVENKQILVLSESLERCFPET